MIAIRAKHLILCRSTHSVPLFVKNIVFVQRLWEKKMLSGNILFIFDHSFLHINTVRQLLHSVYPVFTFVVLTCKFHWFLYGKLFILSFIIAICKNHQYITLNYSDIYEMEWEWKYIFLTQWPYFILNVRVPYKVNSI